VKYVNSNGAGRPFFSFKLTPGNRKSALAMLRHTWLDNKVTEHWMMQKFPSIQVAKMNLLAFPFVSAHM
jgi:hypothetical protein